MLWSPKPEDTIIPPKNKTTISPFLFILQKLVRPRYILFPVDYSNFRSPVIRSIKFSGAGPIEMHVVVPGAI